MAQNLNGEAKKAGRDPMNYHILCIDDDPEFLLMLKLDLDRVCRCTAVQTMREALQVIHKDTVDLVLLDIGLGRENGIDGLKQIKKVDPSIDVVMVTAHKDPKLVVSAVRGGASDYICKPFEPEELVAVIEKLRQVGQMRNRHDALIADLKSSDTRSRILGTSKPFRDLLDKAGCVKGHNANVLIVGESGTGKEVLARYIHNLEGDSRRPFIAVNCAAIPDNLLESELFGHEKGSFTGAVSRKIGKFELACGGDIFLDEISTLKPEMQAKILRTLQEKEVSRIGSTSPIKVDFRVIAATNEDLDALVKKGGFRMDLFHRLRVIQLDMPPLRERVDDIPLLSEHFLAKYSKAGREKTITADALEILKNYEWPGNIRELENLIHNLVVMAPGGCIDACDLPNWVGKKDAPVVSHWVEKLPSEDASSMSLKEYTRQAERAYIEQILMAVDGDKSKAADKLDVSRTTLYSKLKELQIDDAAAKKPGDLN